MSHPGIVGEEKGATPRMERKWTSGGPGIALGGWMLILGCGPSPVRPPQVDLAGAASQIMATLDTDSDGALSESELGKSPPLFEAREKYDLSHDKRISRDEVQSRLEAIYGQGLGITQFACTVMLDGRPLSGAEVRFVPESFLGENVSAAHGTTNSSGVAAMSIPIERLPSDLKGFTGIHPGVYRVEITHSLHKLPEKYNTKTVLGLDTHPDSQNDPVVFQLQSH